MSNEFFVTGLILVTLIIGAALLPAPVLLRPYLRQQLGIGLISGIASLIVAVLHFRGEVPGISFVYPSLLASVAFLFGPCAGGVAVICSLFSPLLDHEQQWFIDSGLSISMWGLGSLMWLARRRLGLHFWLAFFILVVMVPLVITPWATLENPLDNGRWDALHVIPWRYVLGMVVLSGSVGLLMSRARALQLLQLRDSQLAQVLRATGGGRWEWDLRTRQFCYHGSFFRDFGLDNSPDDDDVTPLVPLSDCTHFATLRSRIHSEDMERIQNTIQRVFDGVARHFHGEFRIVDNHGRCRWLIARGGTVEYDEGGRPRRISGMLLDATDHHEMASALRLSEVKYTTFFKTLPDPAGIVRMSDGCYMDINPAMERLCKRPASQIVGRTAIQFGLILSKKDVHRLMPLLKGDSYVHGEPLQIQVGDSVMQGLLSARTTLVDGEECMVYVFHDMTQANAVAESLRVSTQSLQQASWLARLGAWEGIPGQGVTFWSDVCCEIHGVPFGTPPPADYIDRFVAPEWRARVREASQQQRRERVVWDMEFEIIRADQQRVWVRVRSESVIKDGKLVKIRGVLQDIDTLQRASERMQASEARFERIFQALPLPLCFVRQSDGRFVDINPAWEQALGYTRAECIGQSLVRLQVYSRESRERLMKEVRKCGQILGYENELRSRSGVTLTVLQSLSPIEVAGEACWLISVLDITERKLQERKVREREELLSLTISASALGMWDWDLLSGQIRGDARWHELQGSSPTPEQIDEAVTWSTGINDEQLPMIASALQLHLTDPEVPFDVTWRIAPAQAPTRWLRNVGKVIRRDADGIPRRMVGVAMDVTLQHERQELLHHMAHYDSLTGLPNRALLSQRLREAVARCDAQKTHMAIAYIDLDALKAVNDRFGHEAGDRLLVQVAGRLRRALRPADSVARLGGDEFVVLLADLTGLEGGERRLKALMEAVGAPYDLGGILVELTASVGYTYYPEDSADTETLLRHADQAMYVAKQAGGNRLRAFDSVQETARQSLVEQRARFDHAMDNGEISLYLQPKVAMRTGVVIGAEALVRWEHPEHGLLLPGSFLHVIDGTELEAKFSDWAMDSALSHIARLKREGLEIQVSININADRLRHRDFANWVLGHLERYPSVHPRQLDVEITENAAVYDVNHVARELAQLRTLGVSVSLDDFGTGYSSLAYLRRLPIDQLKLDQSYVRGMMNDPADQAIVQGVIGLARSFGYHTVAEGVESVEQGILLVRMGCMVAQGHFISPPIPVQEFARWACHWRAPKMWLESTRTMSEPLPLV